MNSNFYRNMEHKGLMEHKGSVYSKLRLRQRSAHKVTAFALGGNEKSSHSTSVERGVASYWGTRDKTE